MLVSFARHWLTWSVFFQHLKTFHMELDIKLVKAVNLEQELDYLANEFILPDRQARQAELFVAANSVTQTILKLIRW
jgi:hypothetical protein